jgi:hypothetical protein
VIELLSPLWAHYFSATTHAFAAGVEIAVVLLVLIYSWRRVWRTRPAGQRCWLSLAMAVGMLFVVLCLNLIANVLVWMRIGETHQGQGAPFW